MYSLLPHQRHRLKHWFLPKRVYWGKLVLELTVVFLGVTAGFLLNNWQENRRLKVEEKNYIAGMIDDINQNIVELKNQVESDSLFLAAIIPQLDSIVEGTLGLESANAMLQKILRISSPTIRNVTFETAKNSGNLGVIRDYEIRKKIIDYDDLLKEAKFFHEFFLNYFNTYTMPFLMSRYNLLERKLKDSNTIETTRFGNVIAGQVAINQQRKESYQRMFVNSTEICLALKEYYREIE